MIEKPIESRGTNGEVLVTWSTFATVKAEVTPLQGKETFLANQELAEHIVRFRIRYLSGVTPKMRVSYDSRIFDIDAPPVNVNELGREMHLVTREVI